MINYNSSFRARYGGAHDITQLLSNPHESDNTHTTALDNPHSTREHVDMVLKNPHHYGEYTKRAVLRHPTITFDDLKSLVMHFHKSPSFDTPAHIIRAKQKLADNGFHYNFVTKDFSE